MFFKHALEGKEMINVGKNGRTKNYDLQKRIKTQKKNLPAHYIGKWDEEEKLWYGKSIGRYSFVPERFI